MLVQSQVHYVPREFLQLSTNADESRKRTEALFNSSAASEPLPIKLLLGNHQHDGGTSHVHVSVNGIHHLNGSCEIVDFSAHRGHVSGVSSPSATAVAGLGDVVKLANGEEDPDCSESMSRMNGEVQRLGNGHEHLPTLSQRWSGGSAKHTSPVAGDNGDFVLIAAGHEVTLGQQKQGKDDKSNRQKQQTYHGSDSSAPVSPVKQETQAVGCSTYNPSVSDQHRKQTRGFSNATVTAACNNQRDEAREHNAVNWSASKNVGDHGNGRYQRPRHGSSNAAAVPATSTCQTVTGEYHAASSSASLQSDCDVASLSSDSSSPINNGVMPRSSDAACLNSAAAGQQETASPSNNSLSEGGAVGQSPAGRADASPPCQSNGIGRGQVLRMMLRGSPQ